MSFLVKERDGSFVHYWFKGSVPEDLPYVELKEGDEPKLSEVFLLDREFLFNKLNHIP